MNNVRFLSQKDASTLSTVAESLLRLRSARYNSAEEILDIISSASLVSEGEELPDCVSLYTTVFYNEVGLLEQHSLTIVCPHEANETLGRVSVLAPLALALIGQVKGSIVEVPLPFGQVKFIKLIDVHKPEEALYG
jgi:regulator of nucleoside diphosphate kinase